MADLERDLNALYLEDGSPNPFHGVLKTGDELNRKENVEMLFIEAPSATTWEAQLSLPKDQPGGILADIGFKLGANAKEADVKKATVLQERKALTEIGGFKNISAWSLWPGAMVLVVGGLLALAFQWRTMGRTFASIFTSFGGRGDAPRGALDHIEIPMSWFVIGFLVTGLISIFLLNWIFSIYWWMGAIAVVVSFFLAAVAARAGAEIGINPIGAMGKVTQLTYGALAPGNITANLMTAGLTAGAACSCSDTVGNLKVGHMVGANPRRQFIAQLFGVLAGALLAVPAYFILVPDADMLGGERFPAPSALVWKGVAKVLSKGLDTLPPGAAGDGRGLCPGRDHRYRRSLLPQGQALHALPRGTGHRPDHSRLHRSCHVPRRADRLGPRKKGAQLARHVHDSHRVRLHRGREHHGGNPRSARSAGSDAVRVPRDHAPTGKEKNSWIAVDKLEKRSKIRVSLELRAKKINALPENCREFLGIFRYHRVSKGLKK